MDKREIAYELSSYSKWEIYKVVRATFAYKKYKRLTKEKLSLDDMVDEVEETEDERKEIKWSGRQISYGL